MFDRDLTLPQFHAAAFRRRRGEGPRFSGRARAVFFLTVLAAGSAGDAQGSPDSATVTFWPQPLTGATPPVDPRARELEAAARRLGGETTPRGGDRQPADRAVLHEAVDARLDAIAQQQALNGERATALIDELTALAELYRDLGEFDSAASALEDAIQIARINFGLYSLDQVDAVASLVAVERLKGAHARAAEHRVYLRELARRKTDKSRVVGVLNGLAAEEMRTARELLETPAPAQVVINPPEGATIPLPPQKPALIALGAARSDYIATLRAALRTRTGNARDWSALENALVETVYFEYAHPELHGSSGLYGRHVSAQGPVAFNGDVFGTMRSATAASGTQILRSRVRDSVTFGLDPVEIARAVFELGDWYLVHSEFDSALTEYERARDMLVKRNVPRETLDAMLSPEVPPLIPVLPASTAGTLRDRARGYFDVSVEITRFGFVKRVNIVARSSGASKAVEKAFRAYVASARFRPRFVNGGLARTDRFDARFYFD